MLLKMMLVMAASISTVGNLRGGCGRGSDSGEDFAARQEKERVTLEGLKAPNELLHTGIPMNRCGGKSTLSNLNPAQH